MTYAKRTHSKNKARSKAASYDKCSFRGIPDSKGRYPTELENAFTNPQSEGVIQMERPKLDFYKTGDEVPFHDGETLIKTTVVGSFGNGMYHVIDKQGFLHIGAVADEEKVKAGLVSLVSPGHKKKAGYNSRISA